MTDSTLSRLLDEGRDRVARAQQALADEVEEHDWEVDFERATITFANGVRRRIQVLGTESSETWMWAWANDSFDPWPASRAAAESVRRWGEAHGVGELTAPRLPLPAMDAHTAGAVGLLLTDADAYFAGAHDGGRIALLLGDAATA